MSDRLEQLYIKLTERCNRLILIHSESVNIEEEIEVVLEEIANERELLLVEACNINCKVKKYNNHKEELDKRIEDLLKNSIISVK